MYKTGDRHPTHNHTVFVEYAEDGIETWTSDYPDPTAPFRLGGRKKPRLDWDKCTRLHSEGSAANSQEQRQQVHTSAVSGSRLP